VRGRVREGGREEAQETDQDQDEAHALS
jgi:hypothetical protein